MLSALFTAYPLTPTIEVTHLHSVICCKQHYSSEILSIVDSIHNMLTTVNSRYPQNVVHCSVHNLQNAIYRSVR